MCEKNDMLLASIAALRHIAWAWGLTGVSNGSCLSDSYIGE